LEPGEGALANEHPQTQAGIGAVSGGSPRDEDVIETGEGSAGEAKELDPEAAAARADELGPESKEKLDARQEKLRPTRRWGGPDLDTDSEAGEDVPDVEPTEPEEEEEPEPESAA
jgi:hypothetical protein